MSQRKSKKSGRSSYDTAIAYDREICIEICRQLILRKELQDICSKPPMPPGQAFLCWVHDHKEACEIYRSAQNFRSNRALAKELDVPLVVSVSEWEEQVRANIELGWPADWIERKYIPPHWSKVFPLIGGPPVGSTEDLQAYSDLLNAYTEMLQPRDVMELGWTKEATDAAWEAQAVTAVDYGALRARSKNYQAVDRTRMRAIKRRDNALRQIARWRKDLGAKPRRLPDHLVVEHLLARRYGVEQPPAEAEADAIAVGTPEPAPPLAATPDGAIAAAPMHRTSEPAIHSTEETTETAPAVRRKDEAAEAGPPFAKATQATQAAPPLAATPDGAIAAAPMHRTSEPAIHSTEETTEAAPAVRRKDEAAEAGPPFAVAAKATEAAPPLAAAGDGVIAAASVHPHGAGHRSHARGPPHGRACRSWSSLRSRCAGC